jgi:hypothetical protein
MEPNCPQDGKEVIVTNDLGRPRIAYQQLTVGVNDANCPIHEQHGLRECEAKRLLKCAAIDRGRGCMGYNIVPEHDELLDNRIILSNLS